MDRPPGGSRVKQDADFWITLHFPLVVSSYRPMSPLNTLLNIKSELGCLIIKRVGPIIFGLAGVGSPSRRGRWVRSGRRAARAEGERAPFLSPGRRRSRSFCAGATETHLAEVKGINSAAAQGAACVLQAPFLHLRIFTRRTQSSWARLLPHLLGIGALMHSDVIY